MIDFACRQFNISDIIKCGLGLTKAESKILEFFMKNHDEYTTDQVSKKLSLNLTTIQKGVKKLADKGVLVRHQKNLSKGGYVFTYESESRDRTRAIIKTIIRNWSKKVEQGIDSW